MRRRHGVSWRQACFNTNILLFRLCWILNIVHWKSYALQYESPHWEHHHKDHDDLHSLLLSPEPRASSLTSSSLSLSPPPSSRSSSSALSASLTSPGTRGTLASWPRRWTSRGKHSKQKNLDWSAIWSDDQTICTCDIKLRCKYKQETNIVISRR